MTIGTINSSLFRLSPLNKPPDPLSTGIPIVERGIGFDIGTLAARTKREIEIVEKITKEEDLNTLNIFFRKVVIDN